MIELEEISNKNRDMYQSFEEVYEVNLKPFQSRIFPNQTAEFLLWYYIKAEDKYIGAIWLEQEDKNAHAVVGLFIAYEEFRNQGCGKEALKIILQQAAQSGMPEVYLHVREQNTRAINCYLRIGFEVVNAFDKNGITGFEMVYRIGRQSLSKDNGEEERNS